MRYEAGIDAATLLQLSPEFEVDRSVDVLSQNPLRVELTYEEGGSWVQFVLEEDGQVHAVERG
jgi:hypothetical protein